jgi:NADH:ubiquinone oxidoreductase subunit K
MTEAVMLFTVFGIGVVLTAIAGFYCLVTTRSLLRALIAVELLAKSVTLLIILAGWLTNRMALAQTLAITLIIIEVAIVVVAVSVVLALFKQDDEADATTIRTLKG